MINTPKSCRYKVHSSAPNSMFIVLLIAMAFTSWMSIKLPVPALPLLGKVFGVNDQALKVSITLNLLGFSFSQIIWGPLSDRFGRRATTLAALIMTILGAGVAMLANNVLVYIFGRILEGFAVGYSAPIGRAIMADSLHKKTLSRVYAWYAIAALIAPAIGPLCGSYIIYFANWRYIFAFTILLFISLFIGCYFFLPETKENLLKRIHVSLIAKQIKSISTTANFWRYVLIYALINGYMIAFYTATPFWYVLQLHVPDQVFPWLIFAPIASYIISSKLTNHLIDKFTMDTLLLFGIIIGLLTVFLILLLALIGVKPDVTLLTTLISLLSFSSGMVTPLTNSSLMHIFRQEIAIASAKISGIRVTSAALLALISTNIRLGTYYPLFIYTAIIFVTASLLFKILKSKTH
ncbi:MAG: MFS transporter [Pseudomonadota bacterium]